MSQHSLQIIERLDDYLSILQKEDFSFLKTFIDEVAYLKKKGTEGEVIIPLVGEFSSGKSSLINAVLKQKTLPVDITPTTFLVNEIRFSSDKDYIEIHYDEGIELIEGLIDLNEKDYTNARLIKIYSTTNEIPPNLTLVDIPGLSSVISQHDEIIAEYVPKADAVFIVVDINQGTLTKTTLTFLDYVKALDKKSFIILTKADTKAEKEIEEVKQYIKDNFDFVSSVISTSAKEGRLDEFYSLINDVKRMSNEILVKNISDRFRVICSESIKLLNNQLDSSTLDISDIEKQIDETKKSIDILKDEYSNKINKLKEDIESIVRLAVNKFYKGLEARSSSLAEAYFRSRDEFENEFRSAIEKAQETASNLLQREFKVRIKEFQHELTLFLPDPDVSSTTSGTLNVVNEGIKIALLNLLLPGGIVPAIFADIVLKLLEKIPRVGKYAIVITQTIKSLVTEIGKIFAKSYVINEIKDNIRQITYAFEEELLEQKDLFFRELRAELTRIFDESVAIYNANLKKLLEAKKMEESKFIEYISNLKNAVSQLKRICTTA